MSSYEVAIRLRGGRQGQLGPHFFEFAFLVARCSCPTRAAARGDRAPCTPGPGRCPWEPQLDAVAQEMSGAHAYGQIRAGSNVSMFWHTKSMYRCIYSELTSFAGGLGACYDPNGERDGCPLGVKPARIPDQDKVSVAGGAGGRARPHARSAPTASGSGEREGRSPPK